MPTDWPTEPAIDDELERERRFGSSGTSLRQFAARGTLINSAFMGGLVLLGFVRGFLLARFLSTTDYGLIGVLTISIGTLVWLKQLGIGEKYVQQSEADQEIAFQKAFTLEMMSTAIFSTFLAVVLPLYSLIYGQWKMLIPGLVVVLIVFPLGSLQAPLWIFYRRMDFRRQRALQALDPIVGFVVTVVLAIEGVGYWSVIIGMVAGALAAATAAIIRNPYRLRFVFDRITMRSYWSFSWPLFVNGASSMVIAQTATIATEARYGLAGAGALSLAGSVVAHTHRLDEIITNTLYPAICAVRNRVDLLQESFVKSNRLSLMWAMPFGLTLALFSSDLVHHALGNKWRHAIVLLEINAIVAAVSHIAFNWDAYFRARGQTRPMAVAAVAAMTSFLVIGLPLFYMFGLTGLAAGIAVQAGADICTRVFYLSRLFDGFSYLRHACRSILPALPGVVVVLAARAVESGPRHGREIVLELLAYGLVTAAFTLWLERPLLREVMGYMLVRRKAASDTPAPA